MMEYTTPPSEAGLALRTSLYFLLIRSPTLQGVSSLILDLFLSKGEVNVGHEKPNLTGNVLALFQEVSFARTQYFSERRRSLDEDRYNMCVQVEIEEQPFRKGSARR